MSRHLRNRAFKFNNSLDLKQYLVMNTPPTRSENPEAGASAGTKPKNDTSGNQESVRARRPGTILKGLAVPVLIIAVSVTVYFLAIYPRVQNTKQLAAAAAAAGKTTVTVIDRRKHQVHPN